MLTGENLLGTVRRSPNGTMLAVLWPSPPHAARWMVTDRWGSCGYETDDAVAAWPVVGAVPFSPAAGMELADPRGTSDAAFCAGSACGHHKQLHHGSQCIGGNANDAPCRCTRFRDGGAL